MRVGPTINEQNRMLTVEADVRNRDHTLRPGAFAQVEIVTDGAAMVLAVPTGAVVTFAGLEKVLVVNEGKVVEKPISTGQRTNEWTEGGVSTTTSFAPAARSCSSTSPIDRAER